MKYKVKFDYEIMDVIIFTILNTILLIVTFGLATPFIILNFLKLISKGLEISDSSEPLNHNNENPSWTELHRRSTPGKML